jgi:cardiolipin synthase A/B
VAVTATGSLASAAPERDSAPGVVSSARLLERENPACAPDSPRASPLRIWVLPEAGAAPFVEALSEARKSIRVMIYQMGEGPILEMLERKSRSGVRVQVIFDGQRTSFNQPAFDRLHDAGARVHWSSPEFYFTHAKTMILDDAVAMIATANYDTIHSATSRDYVVRDTDPDDVAVLKRLFDADWQERTPDLRCTRLLISPINARRRLLSLIDGATRTLDIESTQLADDEVRSAVLERAEAGVAVRVILAEPSWIEANLNAAKLLMKHGVPVRLLRNPGVHAKAILVDGRKAYVGSINLSRTSISENREIGLITKERPVLDTISRTFATDWANAISF